MSDPHKDELAQVSVTHPPTFQGLTLWCGDSLPVHVDDFMDADDLRDLIQNPTLRAVVVARLRSVADLLASEPTTPEGSDR